MGNLRLVLVVLFQRTSFQVYVFSQETKLDLEMAANAGDTKKKKKYVGILKINGAVIYDGPKNDFGRTSIKYFYSSTDIV